MTREEIIAAAEATLRLARHHAAIGGLDELSPAHLGDMMRQMREPSFSLGKLNRWLGWMQAAVVAGSCGKVTLADMKEINRPKVQASCEPKHDLDTQRIREDVLDELLADMIARRGFWTETDDVGSVLRFYGAMPPEVRVNLRRGVNAEVDRHG